MTKEIAGLPVTTRAMTQAIKDAVGMRWTQDRGEHAILWEVAAGVGAMRPRYLDALVMGTWPSRGLFLEGVEIKATRSDWVRELRNPEKQGHGLYPFLDFWWVAAAPGVVKVEELPRTWGLLELQPAKPGASPILKVIVAAPSLSPQPITRDVLAGLLRRKPENAADQDLAEAFERGKAHGYEEGLGHGEVGEAIRERDRAVAQRDEAQKQLDEARKALGITQDRAWRRDTVKAILDLHEMMVNEYPLLDAIKALEEGVGVAKKLRAAMLDLKAKPPDEAPDAAS